jgi:predicted dienelactone hydrolase
MKQIFVSALAGTGQLVLVTVPLIAVLVVSSAVSAAGPGQRCLVASGGAAAHCVRKYAAALRACRDAGDAGCEAALHSPGGTLDALLAATARPVRDQRDKCTAEVADKLTFGLGLDDLVFRTAQACQRWGDDLVASTYAGNLAGRPPEVLACQRVVGARLARLHDRVVKVYGQVCYVAEFGGSSCDRARRDRFVARARAAAGERIERVCGPSFDALGLVALTASPTLAGRIDALMDVVASRARHLAQRVYPPLNLGPTGLFGPHPVGVRTLDLVDPSRPNPVGPGLRTLTTEVYYPSTPEAVAGVPRDTQQVLVPAPTYRDVARAPGTFPLIVYSHGGGGIRYESAFKLAHLASHGFVVLSADHPGSDAVNVDDPDDFENRPLDVRFLIDQTLAFNAEPGHFLAGAIDPLRIGGTGWSFGGYAVLTLATGPFFRGTFTDPRLKAVLTFDGSMGALHWGADAPAIFGTIAIPTLSLGGDALLSVPLVSAHQAMFDALQPGPSIMGYGVLHDASHTTFPDDCEVPDALVGMVLHSGIALECLPGFEPQTLPSRYARHIINYLTLNFFDAVLKGNPEALARLDPNVLAGIEELVYQSK